MLLTKVFPIVENLKNKTIKFSRNLIENSKFEE